MKVVSIDPGKSNTKFAYINEEREIVTGKFETKITRITDLNDMGIIGADNYKVEYEGVTYVVGSQGEMDATDERTKKSEAHRMATLVAITQALHAEEEEIVIMNNIPALTYKSKESKEEYTKFYKKNIEISVNDTPYSFNIVEAEFLPESVGFVFKHPELCKGLICVIDIGKFNIGLVVVEDGVIKQMTTLDLGGIELENQAIEKLETKFDKGIDKQKIIDYLIDGYAESWGEKIDGSDAVISDVKEGYINLVIKEALKKKVKLEIMNRLFFIGGTSLVLKENIHRHSKLSKLSAVPEDADTISVVGNLIYGERKYNGKQANC